MNKKRECTLSIVQLNGQRSSTVAAEISKILREGWIGLLLLQEPFYAFQNVRGFPMTLQLLRPLDKNPMVAAICDRRLDPTLITKFTDRNILTMSVRVGGIDLYIINVYCQFGEKIEPYMNRSQEIIGFLSDNRPILIKLRFDNRCIGIVEQPGFIHSKADWEKFYM